MTTIKYNAEYASQVMTTIPIGYINKNICGVGMSSLALENEENIIIAVPSVELIKNKIVQYPNKRCSYTILGVYGDITNKDIDFYLKSNKIIKIMVTFDSLYKVEDLIKIYNCKLIIDESNKLLSFSSMKSISKRGRDIDVVTEVFNIAEKYQDVVSFVSATPTPLEYLPEWVSNIPYIDIQWNNTGKAKPILMERRYPYNSIVEEIISPLETNKEITIGGTTFSKVIVFINSVKSILSICKQANLSVKDVRVIAGASLKNDVTLKKYKRLEDPTNLTKYTFVTSTGFEGIDLVDSNAISIVVSNTSQKHQMIDIMTDLKQAVSRQRDKANPNYDKFIYIYNTSIFSKTEQELIADIDNHYQIILGTIRIWEAAKQANDTESFSYLKKDNTDHSTYTNFDTQTQTYTVNTNLFNSDKYFILVTRRQYKKGFDIRSNYDDVTEIEAINVNTVSYKDMATMYNNTKNINVLNSYKYKEEYYNLIITSIKLYDKVWTNYTYAKQMIANYNNDVNQVLALIKSKFKLNHTYTSTDIKKILQSIYKQYSISKTPKANDLNEFCKLKTITNPPRGFQIINFYN